MKTNYKGLKIAIASAMFVALVSAGSVNAAHSTVSNQTAKSAPVILNDFPFCFGMYCKP